MTVAEHVQFVHDAGVSFVQAVVGLADPSPTPTTEPAPTINTNGIVEFLASKVAPILLAVLGVFFISRAGKGEMSRVLTSSAIAIIGIAFVVGATALFFFGKNLIDLIIGPSS